MVSRAEQDEWLKSLGIQLPKAALQPAGAAASSTAADSSVSATPPAAVSSPPTKAPPPASGKQAAPASGQGAAPATTRAAAKELVEVWPEQLLALGKALDGVKATVQTAAKQENEIAAAGAKAKIDPKKTDAIAKAATRLGGKLTSEEHSRLKRGESEIQKSKLSIEGIIDRISEAKDQLLAFLQLDLEEVYTPDEKEKMGHEVATIYDSLINFGKAVIDIVTGDFAKYAGWIIMQATSELAGGDAIKDRIEQLVDGIEQKQNELQDGFNKAIGELNKFRSKEIKAQQGTLQHLRSELNKWLEILKSDSREFGEDLGDIANAHKKDAGDFRLVMGVYRKISEANDLLTELSINVSQDAALSDARWPGLISPLGKLDEDTALGYGLPEGWIAVVYNSASGRHVFLVAGTGGTFASSRKAAPAALDALSAAFTDLQAALAAQTRVAALAAEWSKALSGGLESHAGPRS
jgi:hypothetical protein